MFCAFTTIWPSGLRRWLKAPFRKGVGSNPTVVTSVMQREEKRGKYKRRKSTQARAFVRTQIPKVQQFWLKNFEGRDI